MCMYLHCGSSYHLYLHVRQWSACHERSRSNQIPFWYGLETASGIVWDWSYDYRKHLCYSGSNDCRGTYRIAHSCILGEILSEKNI